MSHMRHPVLYIYDLGYKTCNKGVKSPAHFLRWEVNIQQKYLLFNVDYVEND